MANPLLPDDLPAELEGQGPVDLAVGLSSYNNSSSIGGAIDAAIAGIRTHFPALRFLVVNADAQSADDTREIAASYTARGEPVISLGTPLLPADRLSFPYHGRMGRGSGVRLILRVADRIDAKAVVLVDPEVSNLTPLWVERLARPLLQGEYDFVCPVYERRGYESTMVSGVVYPMTRALYGMRLRQPVGGDFGLSAALLRRLLVRDDWETDLTRFTVDIWMATIAAAENFRVCQTFLGHRGHLRGDATVPVSDLFRQIVESIFALMTQFEQVWKDRSESRDVELFGVPPEGGDPLPVFDVAPLLAQFARGCEDLSDIWALAVDRETLREIRRLASIARHQPAEFQFHDDLWAHILCEFAAVYEQRPLERSHMLGSMSPLYLGWVASFMLETRGRTMDEGEQRIEQLCQAFERSKPRLSRLWDYYRPSRHAWWTPDQEKAATGR